MLASGSNDTTPPREISWAMKTFSDSVRAPLKRGSVMLREREVSAGLFFPCSIRTLADDLLFPSAMVRRDRAADEALGAGLELGPLVDVHPDDRLLPRRLLIGPNPDDAAHLFDVDFHRAADALRGGGGRRGLGRGARRVQHGKHCCGN